MELAEKISQIERECLAAISSAGSLEDLLQVDLVFLSKKGRLSDVLKQLRDVPPEDRPQIGAQANEAKRRITAAFDLRRQGFEEVVLRQRLLSERVDVTLPSRKELIGSIHPISKVTQEVTEIFKRLGFELTQGPEVETEFFNFDALNIQPDHPARDMQDTFYLKGEKPERLLLRTQTSTVQIRTMLERRKPPVRIISPGAVFRSDYDATHSPMFHQIEGLYVDRDVTFAELKGCLQYFAQEMFGRESKVRLRPSFFPFVEPGAEVDVSCFQCKGSGQTTNSPCRLCKATGWIEILGAGMVHPNVFRAVGFDPDGVRGFAFGMGVERVAMLKYGVPDLRLFFENDPRVLGQFGV